MYDRASGLYAYWYFARRFEEEARRADRYARPLAALLVEVKRHEAYKTEDQVTAWLEQELRATDLASHLGDGRYMALLTETNASDADAIVSRLSGRFPHALAIGVGCYPQDGKSLDEVQKAAELRARGHWALSG
jgi:GGDEF domain-containing protein